jgi:hypothetical protein
MTMAGYLFETSRISDFSEMWHQRLHKLGLSYFHMVDCAHGKGDYIAIPTNARIRLQMNLMRLIKEFSINGIVCNVKNEPDNSGKIYGSLVERCFRSVSLWADAASHDGKVEFFFESGAKGAGYANAYFERNRRDPNSPVFKRYGGHTFISKEGNAGIQAADFLAWQYQNFTKKRTSLDLPRLDTRALLRHPHLISDECGEAPVKSVLQNIEESRAYKEVVYYMPKATRQQIEHGSVLIPSTDFTLFQGESKRKVVMACSSCFRALTDRIEISQMRNVIIKCFCGQHSFLPGQWDMRLLVQP